MARVDAGSAGRWWAPRWADIALVIVAFGSAVRLWTWGTGPALWLDEQMISLNLRDRDFAGLVRHLDNNQSAPLGWLWAQRAMVELFGTGEPTLRFLPVVFGVATLGVAWLIGRRWLGPVGTVALTGFCAVNQALVSYSTQVKHYSADSFWVLALLGLAGWVAEEPVRTRRMALWWAAAAVGSWFSIGSILAVPGFSLVLLGVVWWRGRWAPAVRYAVFGLGWLASFGVHYVLALRHTATGSAYLAEFWSRLGYPPASAGLRGTARWLLQRPGLLADDPLHVATGIAGTVWPRVIAVLFWLLVVAGIAVALRRRPAFGLLLAAPPATAVVLALLRIVPLVARLALWTVPVVFVAVACALEAAVRLAAGAPAAWRAGTRRSQVRAAAVVTPVLSLLLLATIVPAGAAAVNGAAAHPALDDRAAVAWLRANHRPGDLVLAFGSAGRAFEWYDHPRQLSPVLAVTAPTGPACDHRELPAAVAGHQRVLAYFGVRFAPYQQGSEVLAARLAELGRVEERRFGRVSVIYIADLGAPPGPPPHPIDVAAVRYNCVRVLP